MATSSSSLASDSTRLRLELEDIFLEVGGGVSVGAGATGTRGGGGGTLVWPTLGGCYSKRVCLPSGRTRAGMEEVCGTFGTMVYFLALLCCLLAGKLFNLRH